MKKTEIQKMVQEREKVQELDEKFKKSLKQDENYAFKIVLENNQFIRHCICGFSETIQKNRHNHKGKPSRVCPNCQKSLDWMKFIYDDEETHDYTMFVDYQVERPNDEELNIRRYDLVYRVSAEGIERYVKYRGILRYKHPSFSRKKLKSFAGVRFHDYRYPRVTPFDFTSLEGHKIFEHTGLKEYFSFLRSYRGKEPELHDMLVYFEKIKQQPQIELLMKSGLGKIGFQIIRSNTPIDLNETTKARDVFTLPKSVLNFIKDFQGDYPIPVEAIKVLEKIHSEGKGLTVEHLRFFQEHGFLHSAQLLSDVLRMATVHNMTTQTIVEYLERCDLYQAIHPSIALGIWYDYLQMSVAANWKHERFPKSLKLQHDLATRDFKAIKSKALDKQWQDLRKNLKELEEIGKEYMIVLPETLEDLVRESKELNHCVKSYTKRIAFGETVVMFLRKSDQPHVPYFTIEVRNGHITQVKGFANKRLDDPKAEEFLKKWKSKKRLLGNI